MQKWEYRIVGFDEIGLRETTVFDTGLKNSRQQMPTVGGKTEEGVLKLHADYLNKLGADGWELVAFTGKYVLKRALP